MNGLLATSTDVAGDWADAARLVIAHFRDEPEARATHSTLRADLAEHERLTRFGSTLLAATSADGAAAWATRLSSALEAPSINETGPSGGIQCELDAETASPERAQELAYLLHVFGLVLPRGGLRPEWFPSPVPLTSPQRAAESLARSTWMRALEVSNSAARSQPFADFRDARAAIRDAREALAASGDPAIDPEMIRLLVEIDSLTDESSIHEHRDRSARAIDRAGRMEGDRAAVPSLGLATSHESSVELRRLRIRRPDLGLPLIAAWLEAQGCTGLRYVIGEWRHWREA